MGTKTSVGSGVWPGVAVCAGIVVSSNATLGMNSTGVYIRNASWIVPSA